MQIVSSVRRFHGGNSQFEHSAEPTAGGQARSLVSHIGAAPAAAAQRRFMAALVPGQTSCDCQFWCGMAPVRDILSRSCCGRILERCVLPCGVLAACRHARRSPGHQDLQVYV